MVKRWMAEQRFAVLSYGGQRVGLGLGGGGSAGKDSQSSFQGKVSLVSGRRSREDATNSRALLKIK